MVFQKLLPHYAILINGLSRGKLDKKLAASVAQAPSVNDVRGALEQAPGVKSLLFESAGLAGWDSRFVAFILNCADLCRARNVELRDEGLPEGVRRLLRLAADRLTQHPMIRIYPHWLRSTLGKRAQVGKTCEKVQMALASRPSLFPAAARELNHQQRGGLLMHHKIGIRRGSSHCECSTPAKMVSAPIIPFLINRQTGEC
jgi:hypothetical protein